VIEDLIQPEEAEPEPDDAPGGLALSEPAISGLELDLLAACYLASVAAGGCALAFQDEEDGPYDIDPDEIARRDAIDAEIYYGEFRPLLAAAHARGKS
jgi:hypothetical protein